MEAEKDESATFKEAQGWIDVLLYNCTSEGSSFLPDKDKAYLLDIAYSSEEDLHGKR